ncbi:GNAT family N-acetyltransferase [Vibrio sp. SCSIO 43136]|uniref:GNAT family N-acetyltransferase n=1 Tax=Vibrio sp. SCSIO 43136 TaxID=2819101 RepID=UPI0020763784|nr:GNAT family N-acetyltransferase [Vibrio sp. SCSIO 43136]USD67602.1 GNAT family N-acetyltransferase [Vibrio sp. SCSIO 43136]
MLELRKATENDLDFLVELRDITMRGYLEQIGGNTDRESYIKNIMWEFEQSKIIVIDGENAGFWRVVFEQDKNRYYLDLVQVHPKFSGQGIASSLIKELIQTAKDENVGLGLSAWKINPAQELYKRLGFVCVGEDGDEWLFEYQPS